uniref:Transposase n=1 Tax=Heterorhabditis bacteriophora TaxID=37862 RepID=A0A1I7XFF2_HETBA
MDNTRLEIRDEQSSQLTRIGQVALSHICTGLIKYTEVAWNKQFMYSTANIPSNSKYFWALSRS